MNVEQFILNIEGYYGEYRSAVKPIVMQWIFSQHASGPELSRLFAELVKAHTSQYRTPPDVAIMLPILAQIKAEAEHQWLADMTRLQLPDASEIVDRETQDRYWEAMTTAMREGRDLSDDQTISSILDRLGVLNQVSE